MATTFDITVLRDRFKTRTHGLADALSNDELDEYLDYAYKFLIPSRVDGYLTDGEWSESTVVDQVNYDLGATVHSVRGPIKVDGDAITTYTRLDHWNQDHSPDGTDTGEPNVALIYGTKSSTDSMGYTRPVVRVYPIPDSTTYTISGGGRLYPSIALTDSTKGNELLTDWTLVWAILAGAAREFALDNGEEDLAARATVRFDECLSMLRTRSRTPAHERAYYWSF